ncbi:hypothetical protein [Actinomadura fibrosa]|uniref:ATP-binding protein n=1 Tax=Actinomadura fibrosa TaxID=111802 RepID=A0ABW2XHM8_9ACTN|nr:hypothetical protein [Actinomadura fibrosa]
MTELVTNAYKHVGVGCIVVRVFAEEREGLVVIEVSARGVRTWRSAGDR